MSVRTAAGTPDGERAYFPALDGLRTICCVWVIVGHGLVHTPFQQFAGRMAGMGVRVFFALSGFLITTLLLRELSARGRVDLLAFYARRALRIFPVYYGALLFALVGLLVFGDRFSRPLGVSIGELNVPLIAVSHGLFVANWIDTPLPGVLVVLWSISVEEQFYLLFPIAFVLSRRRLPTLRPIAVGLLIAFAVRAYLACTKPEEIYRNTFAIGDHLLLGALGAQVFHSWRGYVEAFARRVGTRGEVVAFGFAALLCAWPRVHAWEWIAEASLTAVVSAVIVLLIAFGRGKLSIALSAPWMRRLGQLTYGAYVFHMYGLAVGWALGNRLGLSIPWAAALRTAIGIVLAFAIASVVRVGLERRVLAWRRRFERA